MRFAIQTRRLSVDFASSLESPWMLQEARFGASRREPVVRQSALELTYLVGLAAMYVVELPAMDERVEPMKIHHVSFIVSFNAARTD